MLLEKARLLLAHTHTHNIVATYCFSHIEENAFSPLFLFFGYEKATYTY